MQICVVTHKLSVCADVQSYTHDCSVQVCIVMRMMAEEVTQYRDDLEADSKRHLLSALTACVPQVLPFLEQSMEGNFGQAVAAAQQGQHQMSQLHAAVVTAALGKPTLR